MKFVPASIFTSLLLLAGLGACQRQPAAPVCPPAELAPLPHEARSADADERMDAKLDYLIRKVDSLEKRLATGPVAPQPLPRPAPNPAAVYAVDISGDPVIGPAKAKVTIIKASEYACPFCQRVEPTLEQLLKEYPGQIRIVYKDYIVHPMTATVPAHAACAAHEQGKFAEYNKALWEQAFGKDTTLPKMIELATQLKLDLERFKRDMAGEKCRQAVVEDQRLLTAVGVTGTPAFFINGRFLGGARPIEHFKALIDEELVKANQLIGKNGVTAANYYEKVVYATGKKTL